MSACGCPSPVVPTSSALADQHLTRSVLILGTAGDRDEHCISQFEGSRNSHSLADGQPGVNHDLVAKHCATLDLPYVRTGLTVLVQLDHEYLIPAWTFSHRAHRNRDGLVWRADRNPDAHRGAGRRRVGGALDSRSHHSIACRRVDTRVHRDDFGCDRGRLATGGYVDAVAFPQTGSDLLRDREVHMHCVVNTLQRCEFGALVQILARVQVRHAYSRAEWRPNGLACDDRLSTRDLSQRDIEVCPRTIHFLLGRGTVMTQVLPAVEHCPRKGSLRFLRFQLSFLDGHVKCDEHHACVDDLPGRETDITDGAWELVAQGDRPQRQNRPDRRGGLAVLHLLHEGGRHRLHRLRLVRRSRVDFLYGRIFPRCQSDANRDNRDEQ